MFLNRGHLLRQNGKTRVYEFPPHHQIKSDSSMRLIIETAQPWSLGEIDLYDDIRITPALNLAQRGRERCSNCLEPNRA